MITLLLEIVNKKSFNIGFYNPASDKFKAYPRTTQGVKKAIGKFKKLILTMDGIEDFRISAYEGKKEFYNEKPFIGYIDKETILKEF